MGLWRNAIHLLIILYLVYIIIEIKVSVNRISQLFVRDSIPFMQMGLISTKLFYILKIAKGNVGGMKYEIEGGNLPVVICYPEEGQTLCTECGSMSWMSPNMEMQTNTGGGLKKALGCLFAGESIFLNEYSPRGGSGMIAFAASFPGTIIPFAVAPGNGIIVQKRGFLAMEKGLNLSVYLQERLGSGLFGGEGFIMQKITGNGLVFVEIDGHCKEYELAAGECMIVDTGYVAAMSEICTMVIQSMPVINTAQVLSGYIYDADGNEIKDGISNM